MAHGSKGRPADIEKLLGTTSYVRRIFNAYQQTSNQLTPAYGEDEQDAPLLLECVYEKPVEVVSLAEHPRVVGQPEVLGYHEQDAAVNGILNEQSYHEIT